MRESTILKIKDEAVQVMNRYKKSAKSISAYCALDKVKIQKSKSEKRFTLNDFVVFENDNFNVEATISAIEKFARGDK